MNVPVPSQRLSVAAVALTTAVVVVLAWPALVPADTPAPGRVILAVGSVDGALGEGVELRLTSDGAELATVGSSDELVGRWQIAFYVDQRLSGTRTLFTALDALAQGAADWTRLGEVELVLADDEPSTVVRTTDPELLEQVLYQQSLQSSGEQVLRRHRVEFFEALRDDTLDHAALAAAALERETETLRRRRDQLIAWIAARGRSDGPRALVLVGDALGIDSMDFYEPYLAGDEAGRGHPRSDSLDDLSPVLASYGWIALPIVLPADAADDDRLSLRTNRSIGFRVRLGRGTDEDEEEPEAAELALDAGRAAAMEELAERTGGRVAATLEELPTLVEDLSYRLPVEVTLTRPHGAPVPIRIESSRPGGRIHAPDWVGGHPEAVVEAAIRRSLDGEGEPGELPVRARIRLERSPSEDDAEATPAHLELLVDLSEDRLGVQAVAPRLPLRVSLGIHHREGGLRVTHELVEADLGDDPIWRYERPIELAPTTDAAIVTVHSLATGEWGEAFAEFVTDEAAVVAEAKPLVEAAPERPAGPAIRLLPLPANARTGRVRIEAESRSDVREVHYLLDGERLGVRRRPPYDIRANLGKVPRQHSIIAIAYGGTGEELGRDGLVINEAETRFWIRITDPPPSERVGPVDVRTRLEIPAGRRLERIDYYWNERLFASTGGAAQAQRLLIPIDRPAGYIRVVATLDDGTTAEDVVLMNTQRFESQITVELVELYVVVTDRQGQPVRGLERDDFIVREQGEVQRIESFAVAGSLPLTVGLAIDSSLSLFRKLPEVKTAAIEFLDRLHHDRDRAFLVEFGARPRVVQPVTADLARIDERIRRLQPSGNTAVWEGISLALTELIETSGRRALVVFYDGDDEDESYSFKRTLDLARRSRIPIYLIVMNDEAARTDGRGLAVRSRVAKLEQLARTGGGRVFYVRTDADLLPIFADIDEELRSHYLLTYYPERTLENPEWRPIRVEVTRDDLTARTISGYGSE